MGHPQVDTITLLTFSSIYHSFHIDIIGYRTSSLQSLNCRGLCVESEGGRSTLFITPTLLDSVESNSHLRSFRDGYYSSSTSHNWVSPYLQLFHHSCDLVSWSGVNCHDCCFLLAVKASQFAYLLRSPCSKCTSQWRSLKHDTWDENMHQEKKNYPW